ncbi:hypothetical protein C9374_001691 [Naegleria lovaniensis]|uniref:Uncharacterized protein n=1 Tax=Naegleria lovaniensis TaxID=51637 RepID=A0AA88GWF5_NAELO|nr:uncharacterized protein C9374_001691 [Naegleria lovaniensis]KAG2387359.1 hypothetical protein C9374_001691 [Naegleria lovaniensis]
MTLYFRMNYYSTHLDELPDSFYEKSTMSMQQQASRPILLAAASSGGFPYAEEFAYSIAVQTSGHWEQDKKVVQFVRDYIKKKFKLRTFHLVLCDLNAKDQVEAVVIDTLKLAQKFQVDMMNRLFIYLSNDENHIKPLNHSKSCLTM